MARDKGLTLSAELEDYLRTEIKKARPYRENEEHIIYFDYCDDRDDATIAMQVLKDAGRWTQEDERIAFGPHPGDGDDGDT